MESDSINELESESEIDTDNKKDKKKNNLTNRYKCQFSGCKATFVRANKLRNHFYFHTGERPYKCSFEECDKAYTNPSHLKRHAQSHLIAKSYTCNYCLINISTLTNLKRHYNRAHVNQKKLYCKECSVSFRKKSRYDEHMSSHNNSNLYKCEKCGKNFLTHMKLSKHYETHKSKNYKCSVESCPEVFEKWAQMIKHRKTEHITRYICSICNKTLVNKIQLTNHSKIHLEDRPTIPCPYDKCNRLYYFKRNLNYHIRTKHIGNKFKCDICNIELSSKQKVKEHIIKIHQSEKKPFTRKIPLPRKDIGIAKKSTLSKLTGIQLSVSSEIKLINGISTALLRDKLIEYSSEDDRASDISAKGA